MNELEIRETLRSLAEAVAAYVFADHADSDRIQVVLETPSGRQERAWRRSVFADRIDELLTSKWVSEQRKRSQRRDAIQQAVRGPRRSRSATVPTADGQ
jgi:hypothetical protein